MKLSAETQSVLPRRSCCTRQKYSASPVSAKAELLAADRAALSGDAAETTAALDRLDALWQADQVYLHIVVSHEDINNAETLLRRSMVLCAIGDEELRPALAELRACLGMVAETQQISIKNIL